MSKHETWRTRQFWESVGGLLIEEYLALPQAKDKSSAKRLIDGLIVLGENKSIQSGGSFAVEGRDVIVIQTKSNRLGMYLMGQAFFSREIMERYRPNSIRTVAICGEGDDEMESLCAVHNIEVIVIKD